MEQHYIFSGSLSNAMVENLMKTEKFEPMDVLVSQLDRSGVNGMLENIKKGIVKSLFIDSGAYSIHSGAKKIANDEEFNAFVDEYLDYVNSLDDHIIAVAQVDHIPGVFKQPKRPEDYDESAELSWKNFLYMYPKMKSPEKLIAVFHQGENFKYLDRMLEWEDSNGNKLPYIGISPSNDRSVGEKDIYLNEVYEHIAKSSNPNVHTHLFGYTSLPGLPKFPWYSCDSVSHRLRSAYNKVFTNQWGTISFSRTRDARTKNDMCFVDVCDDKTRKELTELIEGYGFTIDDMINNNAARVVVDICEVQKYVRTHPYTPQKKVRKLFQI